jgi:5-methylcytosine-specific restriction protein A
MTTVPTNTQCSHLGCKNPKTRFSGYCLEHGGRDTQLTYRSEERDKAHAFYLTAQWKRHRIVQLSGHPLCASCFSRGIITPATEVDHVFPWRQIGSHSFYRNLFQSLCHDCHSHKTQEERKGRVMHYTNEIVMTYRVDDYHRVVGVDNP